ncbi:ROK family transcriptional regulator [Cellulomonas endometrii]|uniref:ROK family transcriptional regulator n=1 Tax=Cellulomonas endometrii TaxID=3036301 RepID=UPI0024ADD946|nr:ROK family transcriptional regulator [Cellulomonas endometrii]
MNRRAWPDFFVADGTDPAVLSRAVRRGTLLRLARGVYSGRTDRDPAELVREEWPRLLEVVLPGGVLLGAAARTLADLADADRALVPLPPALTVVEVRHARRTTVRLPGLEVRSLPGAEPDAVRTLAPGVVVEVAGPARDDVGPPAEGPVPGAREDASADPAPARPSAFDDAPAAPGRALSATGRLVGLALVRGGEATRPELGRRLGLSKPTVSTAVAELEDAGLVRRLPARTGATGRSAAVYEIAPSAGWTLGIDLGNTQIRLAARGLGERALAERRSVLDAAGTVEDLLRDAADGVAQLVDELRGAGPLRSIAIALPKPVRADHRLTGREGPSLGGLAAEEVVARLRLPHGVRVLAENNVNCAVLAEVDRGVAQGRRDVVLLQVGERIGAGVVVDGVLVHGARGGAGELADVPFPWAPGVAPQELGLQQHLGAAALVRRWRPGDGEGAPAARIAGLLAGADAGDPAAVRALREHSVEIARLALTLVSVLDPEMVVLGGAIGEHPLVARWVRAEVAASAPHTEIVPGAFAGAATVEGATTLAGRAALGALFGDPHARSREPSLPSVP